MDKAEYEAKVDNLLIDRKSYVSWTAIELNKLVNSINKTADKLRKLGALTRREALTTKVTDAAMARFYGLTKVQKPGVPHTPPCLITWHSNIWAAKVAVPATFFPHLGFAVDSQVGWRVVDTHSEYCRRDRRGNGVIRCDLVIPSIPLALAIDTIDGLLRKKFDEIEQKLKREHIIELLELCLSALFTFNSQIYEQKKGAPMGSPMSGLIAKALLQKLKQLVFSSEPQKFWARHVDDTFGILKNHVQTCKASLNLTCSDIHFTMEEEVNDQLPSFDVRVTKLAGGKIRTTVDRKATNTRRIRHF
ncbi:unnamed protein product [Dibothriocephalus latus]|uniref:Reverse transcriptase domain-containing protein n=1 Tax=Dibothriocephalus latus TaxID=60516 RepID=A0A3P7LXM3_DIBLA|nr:unnamed protein product [Dibothriocephalus latus]